MCHTNPHVMHCFPCCNEPPARIGYHDLSFNEYQLEAIKTIKPGLDKDKLTLYFCTKLAEEVGELVGPLAKNIVHGKSIPEGTLIKESGDLLYYLAALAHLYDIKLQDVADTNIQKIRERHGESYRSSYYKQDMNETLKPDAS